jgi:hypothetical protein
MANAARAGSAHLDAASGTCTHETFRFWTVRKQDTFQNVTKETEDSGINPQVKTVS